MGATRGVHPPLAGQRRFGIPNPEIARYFTVMRVGLGVLVTLLAVACEAAPKAVALPFSAVVDDVPFRCDGSFAVGTSAAPMQPLDLRFYVHDVHVVSGGEKIPLALEDNEFQGLGIALLDFEDDSGSCDTGSPAVHTSITGAIPAHATVDGISFSLGVPAVHNHLDAATSPAPLNIPGLWWSWQGGYKYMKIDVATETNPEYYFHMGATACEGDPTAGFSCAAGNVASIEVAGDAVTLDLAQLYAGVDVNVAPAEGDFVPGCMSFSGDPECPLMFAPLALGFEAEPPANARQTLFRSGP